MTVFNKGQFHCTDRLPYAARQRIVRLSAAISKHLEQAKRGEMLRNGIRVAIFGAPNAGKSSFTNWLGKLDYSQLQ